MKGEFALVLMKGRGKGNEWLLIKKRDEFADELTTSKRSPTASRPAERRKRSRRSLPPEEEDGPQRVKKSASGQRAQARRSTGRKGRAHARRTCQSMLATPIDRPPDGANWVYEIKWDGVRAICYIEDGHIRMVSRNGNSFDRQYPELSVIPHHIAAETAILDAEIAVLDEQGRSRFGLIQPRIHQTNAKEVAHLSRKTPVKLFVFDLLYWDGYDLRDMPLLERKRALSEIVTPGDRIQVSEHFAVEGRRDPGSGSADGPGRRHRQGRDKQIRAEAKPLLAQAEGHRPAGVRHLRVHTRRARHLQFARARRVRRRQAATTSGCVGTGFDDKTCADLSEAEAAGNHNEPIWQAHRRASQGDLGGAAAAVRGAIHRVDEGRPSSSAGLPRAS